MEITTVDQAYDYLDAGFKQTVYIVNENNKVQTEILRSGLSLRDACDLKKEGRLFLTRKEADDAVDLFVLKSKSLTELFTLQQMVMEAIQSKVS